MILLIGEPNDPHLLRVGQELDGLGRDSQIVSLETLGTSSALELSITGERPPNARLVGQERTLDTDGIDAVWMRRRRRPRVTSAVSDPDDRRFADNEWRAALEGLAALLDPGRIVNPPLAEHSARSKLWQLQLARRAGLAIPDTLVTSSPSAARSFLRKHRNKVIHKGLTAPHHAFLETRRWREDDVAQLDLLPLAPIFLQEEVSGSVDLRVTVAGNDIHAASIPPSDRGDVDSRLDLRQIYETFECPDELTASIRRLCAGSGLIFCTIDFKISEDGTPVFFEINPQGQFLYVEIMTGQKIAQSVATTLAEIAEANS